MTQTKAHWTVHIPAGCRQNHLIRFPNCANEELGFTTGDYVFKVCATDMKSEENVQSNDITEYDYDSEKECDEDDDASQYDLPDPKGGTRYTVGGGAAVQTGKFRRVNHGDHATEDLLVRVTVSLTEALTGFRLVMRHLDGSILVIDSPQDTILHENSVIVVKGQGMPLMYRQGDSGNLFLRVHVLFPDFLKQIEQDENKVILLDGRRHLRADDSISKVTEWVQQSNVKVFDSKSTVLFDEDIYQKECMRRDAEKAQYEGSDYQLTGGEDGNCTVM